MENLIGDHQILNEGSDAAHAARGLNSEDVTDVRTFVQRVSTLSPGASGEVDVVRSGERKTLRVTLGRRPVEQ